MTDYPKGSYMFWHTADFSGVANGGTSSATINIDAGNDFVVQALNLTAFLQAGQTVTSNAAVTGLATFAVAAKLARQGYANLGASNNGHLGLVRLAFQSNDQAWQSGPVRADLICGEPGALAPLWKPVILRARTTLTVTLYSDLPASLGGVASPKIDAQLILAGVKVPINSLAA